MVRSAIAIFERSGTAAAGAGSLWLGGRLTGIDSVAHAAEGAEEAVDGARRILVSQATNASAALSPESRSRATVSSPKYAEAAGSRCRWTT
ncbi:hypothetical protein [Streptomyces botrytidirepellens]|uniref:Uncharacterized protein n=1 Tax=Streptomyces botrytidirepellens TaxID=2486417 RepID=A0A3M8W942_9ACTN|nr:hypothetical protein [Streptomyces botrytidirepellens]RNG26070.1 hypothetical protein EEJ42_16280 [Streptomyces botrytidirepellens]